MSGSTATGFKVVVAITGTMATGVGREPDGPGQRDTGTMEREATTGIVVTGNRHTIHSIYTGSP
jgi:hypothetical protein